MMAFIRMMALALVFASNSEVWSSPPVESARDQYDARQNSPERELFPEATDHRPEVRTPQQTDFVEKPTHTTDKQLTTPDLQVGCGDGFIRERSQHTSESDKNEIERLKRASVPSKSKRSYSPLAYRVIYSHPYQSLNVWRPPVYQLSRPYYIPFYESPGKRPIYFPPQPLYVNIGEPEDNPAKKPFEGPAYLPPVEPTKIANRFNGGDSSDDRPVWDLGNDNRQTQRPFQRETTVVPTRRPNSRPRPPLVHNPTDPGAIETPNTLYEVTPAPIAATRPPPRPSTSPPRPAEPSRCVWAIISCCSGTNSISYECFEQRGCPGAFWDNNPCESEFAQAAISVALNYYNKKSELERA